MYLQYYGKKYHKVSGLDDLKGEAKEFKVLLDEAANTAFSYLLLECIHI